AFSQMVPAKSSVAYNTRYIGTTPPGIWNPLIAALGDNWSGSVRVTGPSGSALAGVYLYFPAQYGTDMIAVPLMSQSQSSAGALTAPVVSRQKVGNSWTRWSTVLVQNTTDSSASITLRLFDSNGTQLGSDCPVTVLPRAYAALNLKTGVDLPSACNLLNILGTNFSGSMLILSNDGRAMLATYYSFDESTGRVEGDSVVVRP
ncbi:MAG TPA: hypothetical protein VII92_02550, partial [Anaerolineae bacterium]